jgi:hypothetical protein
MGLTKSTSPHTHARVLGQNPHTLQTWSTQEMAELTTPTYSTHIWSQSTIYQNTGGLPPLNKEDTKYIQAVTGTLLYYRRAVNTTILTALRSIATKQASPTVTTIKKVKQLLDYCASQEEAIITFKASDMILQVHSNPG